MPRKLEDRKQLEGVVHEQHGLLPRRLRGPDLQYVLPRVLQELGAAYVQPLRRYGEDGARDRPAHRHWRRDDPRVGVGFVQTVCLARLPARSDRTGRGVDPENLANVRRVQE